MSPRSRFDKLETERETGEAPASGASLERFAAEPEPGSRAAPVDAMQPEHGAARLQRFDADGSAGLGLDRDPLAKLPMLECPACKTACGKFETVCHDCQTSLTSDEARAHNLQRADALAASRAQELEADRERLQAHLEEAELLRMQRSAAEHGMASELGEKFSGNPKTRSAATWWVAIAIFYLLAAIGPGFGFKLVLFVLATLCLLTRLPRSVWLRLGEKVKPWHR